MLNSVEGRFRRYFGKITGVERSNLREEPEGGLHLGRSIPDDKAR